jgi:hypothetical protein
MEGYKAEKERRLYRSRSSTSEARKGVFSLRKFLALATVALSFVFVN